MIDVTFTLGGQPRAMIFDVGALKMIGQHSKSDALEALDTKSTLDDVSVIAFYGMKREHMSRKAVMPFTIEEVTAWVDALSLPEAVTLLRSFNDATKVEASEDTAAESDEDKKK